MVEVVLDRAWIVSVAVCPFWRKSTGMRAGGTEGVHQSTVPSCEESNASEGRSRVKARERTGTTLGLAFLIVPLVTALQISPRMRSRASPSSSHETVNRGESQRTIEDGSSYRMRRAASLR